MNIAIIFLCLTILVQLYSLRICRRTIDSLRSQLKPHKYFAISDSDFTNAKLAEVVDGADESIFKKCRFEGCDFSGLKGYIWLDNCIGINCTGLDELLKGVSK